MTEMSDVFLDELLTGDESLASLVPSGWHNELAEQGLPCPLGVFRYQGSRLVYCSDDLPPGGSNPPAYCLITYIAVVIGENVRYEDLKPAVDRLKQLVVTAKGKAVDGGKVLWARYAGPFRQEYQEPGGSLFRELGLWCSVAVRDEIVCR